MNNQNAVYSETFVIKPYQHSTFEIPGGLFQAAAVLVVLKYSLLAFSAVTMASWALGSILPLYLSMPISMVGGAWIGSRLVQAIIEEIEEVQADLLEEYIDFYLAQDRGQHHDHN